MIMTNKKYFHEDISDSPEDQKKLKPDQASLILPDIQDIPGATRSGKNEELIPRDSTISSSDEEGEEIFEEDRLTSETDVSPLEKKLLSESFDPAYDEDLPIGSLSLDEKDNEGEKLEENSQASDLFGEDLDDDLVEEEDEESEGESQQ
jgi:hypothetical protein